MTIDESQEFVIQKFLEHESWEDRYMHIMDYGDGAEKMPSEYKTENNIIIGCQTRVWIHSVLEDGKMKIWADAEGKIIKGLVTVIVNIFNNQSPKEILASDCKFIEKMGFGQFLSVNRSNGVLLMVQRILEDANKFIKQLETKQV